MEGHVAWVPDVVEATTTGARGGAKGAAGTGSAGMSGVATDAVKLLL